MIGKDCLGRREKEEIDGRGRWIRRGDKGRKKDGRGEKEEIKEEKNRSEEEKERRVYNIIIVYV